MEVVPTHKSSVIQRGFTILGRIWQDPALPASPQPHECFSVAGAVLMGCYHLHLPMKAPALQVHFWWKLHSSTKSPFYHLSWWQRGLMDSGAVRLRGRTVWAMKTVKHWCWWLRRQYWGRSVPFLLQNLNWTKIRSYHWYLAYLLK